MRNIPCRWRAHGHPRAFALGLAALPIPTRVGVLCKIVALVWEPGKLGELAGYSSALLLIFSAVFLVVESVERLLSPRVIAFQETLVVAFIGLAVNVIVGFLAGRTRPYRVGHGHDHHHGHDHENHGHEDHNHRAAFVHVLADALTSVAAIAALFGAWKLGWNWLDPVVAMVASVVILVWGFGLIRNAGRVLLDSEAPEHERQEVVESLAGRWRYAGNGFAYLVGGPWCLDFDGLGGHPFGAECRHYRKLLLGRHPSPDY